jgi:hypothetical protein
MPRLAHLGLAVLGAALAVPGSTRAGDYPPAASPSSPAAAAPVAAAAPAAVPTPLNHRHYGRVAKGLVPCEKCAAQAKQLKAAMAMAGPKPEAVMVAPAASMTPMAHMGHNHGPIPTAGMPEGSRIIGCAHSSNGVCKTCKALLEMPGEVMVVVPGTAAPTAPTLAAAQPGRAVATDAMPGRAVVAAGDPEPIGVMQTNYSANVPAGAAAKPAAPAMPAQPGRGPFLGEQHETKPHILGHLFGFSAMQRDWQDKWEEQGRKKREKHAAVSYDSNESKVQELPSTMVFGRGAPR